MAGFVLFNKSTNISFQKAQSVFKELDYLRGKELSFQDWNLIVFPKLDFPDVSNWYERNQDIIIGIGTFIYKNGFYNHALPVILDDLHEGKLDSNAFLGSFIIIAFVNDKFYMLRDGGHLLRLHGNSEKDVYSNSFASILRLSKSKKHINTLAIEELLSTGLITGNDTIIEGIEFINGDDIHKDFTLIESSPNEADLPKNQHEAVIQQVENVKLYLRNVNRAVTINNNHFKFNFSITGGLDSRLLTAIALQENLDFDFYTYWRDKSDANEDFRLAMMIGEYLSIPVHYKEIHKSKDLIDESFLNLLDEGYKSCDGVIRPGSFWDEEFTNIAYRRSLVAQPFIRMTGFEGEFYRNMERLPLSKGISYKEWVRWEMIYRFAGHNFYDKKHQIEIENKIINNVEKVIKPGTLDLYKFKKYYRKFIVPSYRSLQNNTENKFGFILSPFADIMLSELAINAIPFLGNSLQFEIDMLNLVSKDLAKLPNDYGFDFSEGEKANQKIAVKIWQKMPESFKHQVLSLIRNHKDSYINEIKNSSVEKRRIIERVEDLKLNLDIKKFANRSTRNRLIINLGYFLYKNENYIK